MDKVALAGIFIFLLGWFITNRAINPDTAILGMWIALIGAIVAVVSGVVILYFRSVGA